MEIDIQNGKAYWREKGTDTWLPFSSSIHYILNPPITLNGKQMLVDLSSFYAYQKITIDNIIFPKINIYATAGGTSVAGTLEKQSYNSSTGILTILGSSDTSGTFAIRFREDQYGDNTFAINY